MFRPRRSRASRTILSGALLLGVLGGCGHAPEKPANARLTQSQQLSQQGHDAYRRGDAAAAIGFYQRALQLNRSIENQAGIVADRINLSRAFEAAGDLPAARQHLDRLVADRSLQLDAGQHAHAYAALALLALKQGNTEEGGRMIATASQACGDACASLAPIANIRALIELERGDPARALTTATASLPLLAGADQSAERANALRIIGRARLARGETGAALEVLHQALALDRELGKPDRIVDDLLLLAGAHAAAGNRSSAEEFYLRAATVAEAADDPALKKRVTDVPGIRRPQ